MKKLSDTINPIVNFNVVKHAMLGGNPKEVTCPLYPFL